MAQNFSSGDSSSDDDSPDYTTTTVLLGYSSREPDDYDGFSQLGGEPKWLDPQTPPSASLARCKSCYRMMALLLQLNADLPERFARHERRVYVFACKKSQCRRKEGSIRGFRGVRVGNAGGGGGDGRGNDKREEMSKRPPLQNLGNALFNSTASATPNLNPFSTSAETSNRNPFSPNSSPNPFQPSSNPGSTSKPQPCPPTLAQTFAQKARLASPPLRSEPPEPWPQPSHLPTPYPSYHIDAELETLNSPSPNPSRISIADSLPISRAEGGDKGDEADAFESPSLDKTFRRFADRLAQNPLQILRYEFAGLPLLYSRSDPIGTLLAPSFPQSQYHHQNHHLSTAKVTTISAPRSSLGIPSCPNCASARVFELQLTPHAISDLEVEEEGIEGMDWGTVILGVCAADCVPAGVEEGDLGYLEEWIGVQWEEIGGKR